MTLYGYATGDRLENRNTYFYSEFHGADFLPAWQSEREKALSALPEPRSPVVSAVEPIDRHCAQNMLRFWYSRLTSDRPPDDELLQSINKILRRFEVTKRIHRLYAEDFRPLDPSDYRTLAPYVRLAELVECLYTRTQWLGYLSVLLKLVDTLCSCRSDLSLDDAAHLAWLIVRERLHVHVLASRVGVNL